MKFMDDMWVHTHLRKHLTVYTKTEIVCSTSLFLFLFFAIFHFVFTRRHIIFADSQNEIDSGFMHVCVYVRWGKKSHQILLNDRRQDGKKVYFICKCWKAFSSRQFKMKKMYFNWLCKLYTLFSSSRVLNKWC